MAAPLHNRVDATCVLCVTLVTVLLVCISVLAVFKPLYRVTVLFRRGSK